MTSPDSSRVYLAVPFAEKDEAKQLGARWDRDRRQWWIDQQDIDRHPGIRKWMVDDTAMAAGATDALAVNESTHGRSRRDAKRSAPVRTLATTFNLPTCACSSAPWEDCEHTRTQS